LFAVTALKLDDTSRYLWHSADSFNPSERTLNISGSR
jgi:hypothetical protein